MVRQLGWWQKPNMNGKMPKMATKPPTRKDGCWWCWWCWWCHNVINQIHLDLHAGFHSHGGTPRGKSKWMIYRGTPFPSFRKSPYRWLESHPWKSSKENGEIGNGGSDCSTESKPPKPSNIRSSNMRSHINSPTNMVDIAGMNFMGDNLEITAK